ncbi:unnamed protein product [Meloidogyne enterolobii]|uniref:Uncharacterized protein n=1 Tax=Meloidogyne enterolobii TaxID=390850 RepID=A0ACB1B4F6_MELEN
MSDYVEIAEKAGLKGDLDRSQRYVKRAEEVNLELEAVRKLFLPNIRLATKILMVFYSFFLILNLFTHLSFIFLLAPKPMRICEVCGSFLIIGDCQQRIDDHMQGKQHLGFARVAETIEELKEKLDKETSPIRSRSRSRSKSPERRHHHSSLSHSSHHHRDRTGSHKSDSGSHKSDKRHDEKHHKRLTFSHTFKTLKIFLLSHRDRSRSRDRSPRHKGRSSRSRSPRSKSRR